MKNPSHVKKHSLGTPPSRSSLPPLLGKGQRKSGRVTRAYFLLFALYCPSLTGEGARNEREGFLTQGFLTEGFLVCSPFCML